MRNVKRKEMDERVTQAIFKAVDEVNRMLPRSDRLDKSDNTALTGQFGALDSLALVNFIVATEQKIEEAFGVVITLVDEKAMAHSVDTFGTIGSLADYITLLLEEKKSG